MYDARMKGHFTEVGAVWTEDHHPLERDQMLCIVPAGVGNRLGAVVAVANQQGFHQNLFSYMRPSIETVSVQDACVESACGSLASREAFVFTASPAEGSVSSDRLLYLRGDNFGPAVAVQSKRGTESKDAARLNQDNQITVTYGGLKCQDVSVLAGGTLATCTIPAREPGAIGCAVEKVLVTVEGQVSAEFSKNSIVSLEPMPLVVPLNPNKKATAWIDGDGATELANKIVGKANEATEVDLEDGSKVVHYGVDTFDTFDLTEFNSGIPISDIQTLHPKECCDKPEGRNEMPLEIIIGVTLTDTDGASSSDAVSIMLTDKEMETPFAVSPLIGHYRSRQIPLACLRGCSSRRHRGLMVAPA